MSGCDKSPLGAESGATKNQGLLGGCKFSRTEISYFRSKPIVSTSKSAVTRAHLELKYIFQVIL